MNNRQSGRRRGRNNNNSNNNNRPQSGGRGGVDQANRIDSRARGNGAQMIEKYRNLARDAQLAAPALLYPALQVNIRGGRLPPAQANGRHYLATPLQGELPAGLA